MRFFDTHAHLNDESFDTDRAALIEGLPSCGAELIMDVAWMRRRRILKKRLK